MVLAMDIIYMYVTCIPVVGRFSIIETCYIGRCCSQSTYTVHVGLDISCASSSPVLCLFYHTLVSVHLVARSIGSIIAEYAIFFLLCGHAQVGTATNNHITPTHPPYV